MLAACMKEVRDVVVLSEPPIVSDLLESDDRRDPALSSVLALYAQRFGVSRVVVKLLSKQTKHLGRFLRRTGHPPAVVLFRHPVEVAVSNLRRPALLDVKRNPEAAAHDFGGSAAAIRRMKRAVWLSWQIPTAIRPSAVSMVLGREQPLKYQPSNTGSDSLRTRPAMLPSGEASANVL